MSDEIDNIPEIPAGASPIAPGTLDRHGVPFDPARHIARQHPTSGRWMPRGGRKPKAASPFSGSTSSPPESTGADTPPPSPPSPAGSPAASEPAPSFDDIEKAAAEPAKPANAELVDDKDAELSPEGTGEILARAGYAVTGAVIGNHKAATATGAEHANIKRVVGAYCRHRGIVFVGTLALIGTFIAYLLDDLRREVVVERIKAFFRAKPGPRTSTPSAPEKTRETAPAAPANANGVPPLAPVTLPASKQ